MIIKTKQIYIALIAVMVLFMACEESGLSPKAPDSIDKQKLLELVNEARSDGCNCGEDYYEPVDSVKWNNKLEEAAQKHSKDMKKRGKLAHTGSNGSSAGERIDETGYNWNTYGENIANGYSTEEAVIQGWLDSPGHCSNIMKAGVTEMGTARSGEYWTQVLAAPQD